MTEKEIAGAIKFASGLIDKSTDPWAVATACHERYPQATREEILEIILGTARKYGAPTDRIMEIAKQFGIIQ